MPKQLSLMEREKISQMRFAKALGSEIAVALGRSPSTISRELKRNASGCDYSAVQAQDKTRLRKATRPFQTKMSCVEINERVRNGLTSYWSPEQIAGRMVCDKLEKRKRVSRSTIERWIKRDSKRKHWEDFLRRRGKRKPKDDRRGHLPSTVSRVWRKTTELLKHSVDDSCRFQVFDFVQLEQPTEPIGR
jgi:transposase, IS30 family